MERHEQVKYRDPKTDALIVTGQHNDSAQCKNAQKLIDDTRAKYGADSIEHVSGFSLGGSKALSLGSQNSIESTSFNPVVGPANNQPGDGDVKQKIIRVTNDPVSLGLIANNLNSNVEVKSINPITNSLNPIKSHDLSNFTNTSSQRVKDNHTSKLLKNVVSTGAKAAELELLDESIANADAGKSFTQHLIDFNKSVDNERDTVLGEDGRPVLSGHIKKSSNLVRSWADAGGDFTQSELDSIESGLPGVSSDIDKVVDPIAHDNFINSINDVHSQPNDIGLSEDERNDYTTESKEGQDDMRESAMSEHTDAVRTLDADFVPVEASNPGFTEHFKSGISPVHLGIGAVSGYLADKAINTIDPQDKIPELARVTLTGGIAGGAGSLIATSLGAESALLPEIGAGAAGYATQYAVDKGVRWVDDKLGANQDVTDASSDILSDAAGGAVSGAILGGPMGAAVGAGIGGVIGLGSYLYHKWF